MLRAPDQIFVAFGSVDVLAVRILAVDPETGRNLSTRSGWSMATMLLLKISAHVETEVSLVFPPFLRGVVDPVTGYELSIA